MGQDTSCSILRQYSIIPTLSQVLAERCACWHFFLQIPPNLTGVYRFRQRKALRSHIYGLGSKGKPRKGGPCLKSQCAEYRVNKPRKSGASFAKRRDFSDSTFSDSHTADAAHVEPLASSSHASARTTGVDKTLQDDENIRKDTLSPLIPPFDVQVENLTTSSPETTQGHSPTPALSPATPMAYYDPVFWGMDPHMGLTAEANSNSNALLPQPALHSILSLPLHSNQPTAAPLIPEMGDSMYPIYLFDPLSCDGNAFSNLKPPDKRRH